MEQKSNYLATQVGGSHYKDMKIQPVEFIHANNIPFIEGACIKYLCRHRNKNGAEDLRKVIHFCEMLIELEYGGEKAQSNKKGGWCIKEPSPDYLRQDGTNLTSDMPRYFTSPDYTKSHE